MKNFALIFLFLIPSFGFNQILKKWEGHYVGDLVSNHLDGLEQTYHMELILKQLTDSSYTWILIYGEGEMRQERNYTLRVIGGNKFEIDEMNEIVLKNNLIKNEFICVFEVPGALMHVKYRFEKNRAYFELTSSENKTETGRQDYVDSEMNKDQIPRVYTYQTNTIQKAVLKKVKAKE